MTVRVYCESNPRIIFTSAAVLNPKGKDLISYKLKSYVVHTYECYCSNCYIRPGVGSKLVLAGQI